MIWKEPTNPKKDEELYSEEMLDIDFCYNMGGTGEGVMLSKINHKEKCQYWQRQCARKTKV